MTSIKQCLDKIDDLEIKLGLKQKIEKTDSEKYDLVDIDDHLLS